MKDELRQLQAELWRRLEKAWGEAGIESVDAAIEVLRQKRVQFNPTTLRRWASDGRVPTDSKLPSRELFEQLAELTAHRTELVTERQRLQNLRPAMHRFESERSHRARMQETTCWFQVIQKQTTREYTSIDLVTEVTEDGLISGKIRRLHPAREAGLRWNFSGRTQGDDAMFWDIFSHPAQ